MSDFEKTLYYASKGDPDAMFMLALDYQYGSDDCQVDESEAKRQYIKIKQLAAEGRLDAMEIICDFVKERLTCFLENESVDELWEICEKYRKQIADGALAGKREELYSYAVLLPEEDPHKLNYMTESANKGYSRACDRLYYYYMSGGWKYVKTENKNAEEIIDENKALEFLLKGIDSPSQDMYSYQCFEDAAIHYYNHGTTEEEFEKYEEYIKTANSLGSYKAKKEMDFMATNKEYYYSKNNLIYKSDEKYILRIIENLQSRYKTIKELMYFKKSAGEDWTILPNRDNLLLRYRSSDRTAYYQINDINVSDGTVDMGSEVEMTRYTISKKGIFRKRNVEKKIETCDIKMRLINIDKICLHNASYFLNSITLGYTSNESNDEQIITFKEEYERNITNDTVFPRLK